VDITETDDDGDDHECVGALIGANQGAEGVFGTRVMNCWSSGSITVDGNRAGGLIGRWKMGYVANCWSNVTVNGYDEVGGFIGRISFDGGYGSASANCFIFDCYATGDVAGDDYVGGFIGYVDDGYADFYSVECNITRCYSDGYVYGTGSDIGGFIGARADSDSNVDDCFFDYQSAGTATSDGGTAKSTAQMKDFDTFINADWSMWDTGQYDYSSGSGVESDPYEIDSIEELNMTRMAQWMIWDGITTPTLVFHDFGYQFYFELTDDLDFNDDDSYDNAANKVSFTSGDGWLPLGSGDGAALFRGSFEGNGHYIDNLYFDEPDIDGYDGAGLFGNVVNSSIYNVHLRNVDLICENAEYYQGALVGYLYAQGDSHVANCSATSAVQCSFYAFAGGLIGCAGEGYYDDVLIENCFADVDIEGESYNLGGFIGSVNGENTIVTDCYSRGDVYCNDPPESSYGGFAGAEHSGSVYNCYSTGTVTNTGEGATEGFSGDSFEDQEDCCWDYQVSGETSTQCDADDLSTADMQDYTTFYQYGWDIAEAESWAGEIWWIQDDADYPRLWFEYGSVLNISIDSFDADAIVYDDTQTLLNVTISHENGVSSFDSLVLELDDDIQLKWDYNLGSYLYSVYQDPNGYATLNVTGCDTVSVDSDTLTVCFLVEFDASWGEGYKEAVEGSAVSNATYVYDGTYYAYSGEEDWFYFAPTGLYVGDFEAPSTVYPDQDILLNMTVSHSGGHGSLNQSVLELEGGIQLLWEENGGSYQYSELADPSGLCTLTSGSCDTNVVDSNTLTVSFYVSFDYSWGVGYKDVQNGSATGNPTYVMEDGGSPEYAYNGEDDLFYFQLYSMEITDFDTETQIESDTYYFFNVTIEHDNDKTDFESLFLCLEDGIQLRWRYNGGSFLYDEYADPSGLCTLNSTDSETITVDAYTYTVCFNAMFDESYGEGWKDVIDPTRVIDQFAGTDYATESSWFSFNPSVPYVPPLIEPDLSSVSWHFRSDTWTSHGVLGYKLHTDNSDSEIQDSRSTSGSATISYGVRVWIVDTNENTWELTDGSPVAVVSRSTDGDGYQSATWELDDDYEDVVASAIQINVYQRFDSDSWSLRRVTISDEGLLYYLPSSNWTFTYHTERDYSGSTTYSYFSFGSEDYDSGVTFFYSKITGFDSMLYYIAQGDIISFIAAPFYNTIGNLFYGFIILFVCGTTYLRYDDVRPVIVLMWLFGGAGGAFSLLLPAYAVNIAYLFLAVAFAATLWRLFR
jgi:hypothetical protein